MVLVFSFYFKSCSEAGMQVTRASNFLSLVLTVLTWLGLEFDVWPRLASSSQRCVCLLVYMLSPFSA